MSQFRGHLTLRPITFTLLSQQTYHLKNIYCSIKVNNKCFNTDLLDLKDSTKIEWSNEFETELSDAKSVHIEIWRKRKIGVKEFIADGHVLVSELTQGGKMNSLVQLFKDEVLQGTLVLKTECMPKAESFALKNPFNSEVFAARMHQQNMEDMKRYGKSLKEISAEKKRLEEEDNQHQKEDDKEETELDAKDRAKNDVINEVVGTKGKEEGNEKKNLQPVELKGFNSFSFANSYDDPQGQRSFNYRKCSPGKLTPSKSPSGAWLEKNVAVLEKFEDEEVAQPINKENRVLRVGTPAFDSSSHLKPEAQKQALQVD